MTAGRARPGVPAGMTARCARPVGAHASPVRRACGSPAWQAGESRAQRVPITAGRARESRARASPPRRGLPGGWRASCHAPGLLTRRCSRHRWRGSWAGRDSCSCRVPSSAALHTPASGAANRHVRRLPRAAGGSAANAGQSD